MTILSFLPYFVRWNVRAMINEYLLNWTEHFWNSFVWDKDLVFESNKRFNLIEKKWTPIFLILLFFCLSFSQLNSYLGSFTVSGQLRLKEPKEFTRTFTNSKYSSRKIFIKTMFSKIIKTNFIKIFIKTHLIKIFQLLSRRSVPRFLQFRLTLTCHLLTKLLFNNRKMIQIWNNQLKSHLTKLLFNNRKMIQIWNNLNQVTLKL